MNPKRITRQRLAALIKGQPELLFSVSSLVNPARPEFVTLYSWRVEGGMARVHGYYDLRSHRAQEFTVGIVEAQLREAGRHFDVGAWERARLARLRGLVAA